MASKEPQLNSTERRQLDIPEHNGYAFALEADIPLAHAYSGRLVLELPVNRQLHSIAFADDFVIVPAARSLLV